MKRIAFFVAVLTAVMVLSATAALADIAPRTRADVASTRARVTEGNGAGQTKLSAAFGFNMEVTNRGHFEYVADPNGPNAGFHGRCLLYASVTEWTSWDGFEALRFRSNTCVDQDGTQVYLRGKIIDRGRPGVEKGDYAHIIWCYTLDPKGQCSLSDNYIDDNGKITAGNIQIEHF